MRYEGSRAIDKLLLFYSRNVPNHPAKIRVINFLNSVLFDKSIQLRSTTGANFYLSTDEYTGHELVHTGFYEPLTTKLCEKLLLNGGNVIDVGASMGLFSIHLSKLPNTVIFAVEPSIQNFSALLRNISLNNSKNVLPLNIALSDHDSFGFLENVHPKNSGTIKVVDNADTDQGYLIRLTTLFELVQYLKITSIKLLKIDVEGFEMNVFKGYFDNKDVVLPENIVMEFNTLINRTKFTTKECFDYLISLGYAPYNINGEPYGFDDPLPESNMWLKRV